MDKDLDDLLESALGDFEKVVEPIKKNEECSKPQSKQSFTIEKTNLYVDDIDYDDRPARTPANKFLGGTSTNISTSKLFQSDSTTKAGDKEGFDFSDENMKMFEEIFNDEKSKDSMKQFKDMLNMFKSEEDEGKMMQNFEKIMSQLTTDDLNEEDDDEENLDFLKNLLPTNQNKPTTSKSDSQDSKINSTNEVESKETKDPLAKVLEDINKNSEKVLKNNTSGFPFGANFFSALNSDKNDPESEDGLDGASSLMMEPILNMLFSKDILYPSLKLMQENYDAYINERRNKLSEEELKKCFDQKECIKEMCIIYESQKENDLSEKRSEDLKKILDLLEKCGMPPSELVPEVNPFEALGNQVKGTGCPIS